MKYIKNLFLASFFLIVFSCSKETIDKPTENGINKAPNQLSTGKSANDFLRLNKPGGVIVSEREVDPTGFAPYSIDEIANLENLYRSKFNNTNILTLYIFCADGKADTDSGSSFTLGTAYRNTSFVLYENTIQQNSGGIGQPSRVNLETTVLLHEFCHLLGLVNLGSPMINAHQDTAHGKHCNNSDCLMNWQVENEGAIGMLFGGSIPELDTNCLNDLIANGGK
jgi:hypothetical protein